MQSSLRAAAWIAGCALSAALGHVDGSRASASQTGTVTAVPVLVELFTAEGCSSCPPADVLLEKLIAAQPAKGAEIVALGEHVDYWNESGWKDRFASAAFTKRQQLYAARSGKDDVYTPQMIVDGGEGFVGTDVGAVRQTIEKAMTVAHGTIRLSLDPLSHDPKKIAVSLEVADLPVVDSSDTADIVVAVTEDGLRTEVKRGENQGRTLTHAAVVRDMQSLGGAAPGRLARASFTIGDEWRKENLKVVGFVQQRRSRRVIATASIKFEVRR
jgi:hypothetical protein